MKAAKSAQKESKNPAELRVDAAATRPLVEVTDTARSTPRYYPNTPEICGSDLLKSCKPRTRWPSS